VRRRSAVGILLTVGLAGGVLLIALSSSGSRIAAPVLASTPGFIALAAIFAAWIMVRTGLRPSALGDRGWLFMGTACGLLAVSELVALAPTRIPGLVNSGVGIGATLSAVGGMLVLPYRRLQVVSAVRMVVDAMVIASSIFIAIWGTTVAFGHTATYGPHLIAMVMAVVAGSGFMLVLSVADRVLFPSLALIGVALVVAASRSVLNTYFGINGVDGLLGTSMLAAAGAAVVATGTVKSAASRRSILQDSLPYLAAIVALVGCAMEQVIRGRVDATTLYAGLMLGAAIIVRQFVSLREARTLGQAKIRAEIESEAKSKFLALMSHELRTPLNSILGFGQLLSSGTFGSLNPKQSRYVENIMTGGHQLLVLVNDVLDLAKARAGTLDLQGEPFEVVDLVHGAAEQVSPQAAAKGHQLTVTGAESTWALGDRARALQIILNLLSNAIKFADAGGRLGVHVAAGDGVAQISVTDSGIGVAPDQFEEIFDEFVQLDSGRARRSQGSGLGLALSRRLARDMSGDITVTSTPGRGSTFTWTVPVCPAERVPVAVPKVARATRPLQRTA
jgi:signal transduction histidine kinase